MKITLVLAAAIAAGLTTGYAHQASACGGCFTTAQGSRTVVAGHRMIVSISSKQTTLWDRIVYSGTPESFAWVLPVKGLADVALSSDALFENLEAYTRITILSPQVTCYGGSGGPSGAGTCSVGYASAAATGGFGGSTGDMEDPVQVVAHQVVGPYETVQLSTQDPAALQVWLSSHGYDLPADVAPMVETYVDEGFDFLALKLVPGQGVDAMRPVRITSPGASPTLPLRMVAAGAGPITPITLWIMGEGRYEPANFPSFTIDESELVWDWNTSSSNYKQLRADAYAASNNAAWLVEAAGAFSGLQLQSDLLGLATSDPVGSGYADDMGQGAAEACQADLDDLFATLDAQSLWVTRIRSEMSRDALNADLELEAGEQTEVSPVLQVADGHDIGDPCSNAFPDCYSGSSTSGGDHSGEVVESDADADAESGCNAGTPTGSGCALGSPSGFRWSLATLVALGAAAAWRRRSRGAS